MDFGLFIFSSLAEVHSFILFMVQLRLRCQLVQNSFCFRNHRPITDYKMLETCFKNKTLLLRVLKEVENPSYL